MVDGVFSSNFISYLQRSESQKFSESPLKAASLSADLVSPLGSSPAPAGSLGSGLLRREGAAVQSASS